MADMFLQTKFIWNVETVLQRATTAATIMGLRTHASYDHGFVAGSQWWGKYELAIHARTVVRTTLTVGASTLKFGFQDQLRQRAQLFIDLARNPSNMLGKRGEEVSVEQRRPRQGYGDWREFVPDDDNSEVVHTQTLPMQASRGAVAWQSLRHRTETMGIGLPLGNWDPASGATAEALSKAPSELPIYVTTPHDVEQWYGYLAKAWRVVPGMYEALTQAMNRNRQLNARWFQENGYGGA